ncbi:hypothetical protein [Amycolatopsis sacchari]|uniref:hypothetical protein n=1 Tax=Amycolatopsis sacchari TaxID=115433 RepID=UPI003D729385
MAEETPPPQPENPPDHDTTVRNLQGNATELAQARMGEYVARGISQLNAETINIFASAYDEGAPKRRRTGRGTGKTRFTPRDLDEATASFVEPAGFQDERYLLADRNLVVLAGPAGTGKRTRALRLLRTVLHDAGLEEVVEELPVSVLANPTWRVPGEQTGFLVTDAPGRDGAGTAAKIGEEWLRKTADRLIEAGSYLVVATGPVGGSLATAPNRAEFVLDEWELPDPLEVLHRRLRDTVPSEAEVLIAQLADTELAEVLAERDTPAFAVRAATEIVEGHRAGRALADTVAKLGDAEGLVQEWLSREPEAKDLSLALATAVLDGAGYLKVSDAAVSLYRRLNNGGSAPMTLRYTRRLLAEHAWIRLVPSGDARRAPSVRFRHPRVRPAVLGVVWCHYDGARAKVLEWLKELAVHHDVEVRAGAAQAIGILAQQDFEHAVHEYLRPWGGDGSPLLRQTAAQGLDVAGVLGDAQAAWSVLEGWARAAHSPDNEHLCTTAALAVGGQLGREDPRRALGVLWDFVVSQDEWEVLAAVAASTGALLEAGCGDEVLRALGEWTGPGADGDALVRALLVFTWVVHPETTESWPLLVRTAERHGRELAVLWGRALADGTVRPVALEQLRGWVRRVDEDAAAEPIVRGLLADIADQGRGNEKRVLHALSQWAQDRYRPSLSAATFYDLMHEAEEEVF